MSVQVVPGWLPMRVNGASKAPQTGQERAKRAPRRQHEAHMTPKGSQKGVQSDPDGSKTGLGTVAAAKSKMLKKPCVFLAF